MQNQSLLIRFALLLLLTAIVIALTQFWGIPLKHILVGIVANILYGLLIIAYVFRFIFIMLGVFAVYSIIKDRHARQMVI